MDSSGVAALKSSTKTYPVSHEENLALSSASVASLHRPSAQENSSDLKVDTLPDPPLQARLSLKFAYDGGTTRLVERDHRGPLLVQKPLYPEGREVCQAVVIHPPGGVVAGDELCIRAHVGASAHAQITSPGAGKWYRSNGRVARQDVHLHAEAAGVLEWMPQETIFFNNASAILDHQVSLEKESVYIGCEILCFGRTASGESFDRGEVRQRTSIRREGKLVWFEQLCLAGGSKAMKGTLGLAGRTVCATFIASGKTIPSGVIDAAREEADRIAGRPGQTGISQFKSILIARYLGDSSEAARRIMVCAWSAVRPAMLGRAAIVPRSWNT